MALEQEAVQAISDYPLEDSLKYVRDKLIQCKDEPSKTVVSYLLGILLSSSTAFEIQVPESGGSVAGKLFSIQEMMQSNTAQYSLFRPLLQPLVDAVIAESSDIDIWTAVLGFIKAIDSTSSPLRVLPTDPGTPVRASSSGLSDSESREIVERELFYEIRNCTHRGVPHFFEKHFSPDKWRDDQEKMYKLMMANYTGTRWRDFPPDPWEKNVFEWLLKLEETSLNGASYKLYTNRTANGFQQRKGQLDIFFQKSQGTERPFKYKNVLVVGEHKRSFHTGNFKACLLQLTRHVRSIFADQPMRRFVHAFTIKGTIMELWVYDRSGAYSSGEFDVHKEPQKLAYALVAYATMENEAMGLDSFIEQKRGRPYITVKGINDQDLRIQLKDLLIKNHAIVCRGTTCFATNRGVAKFSWRSFKQQYSEVELLKSAREKGVEGVAILIGHYKITTIANLRSGLDFSISTQHRFKATQDYQPDGHGRTPTDRRSLSKKRNGPSGDIRSSIQKCAPNHGGQASKEAKADQADLYQDRVLTCIIISPIGRIISDFTNIRELLEALRDAIRAHQSLYTKGQILHRDISPNNIIITEGKSSGGFRGMLIDLDMAKTLGSEPSGAQPRTGTLQFMAIEVLRGIDHSYRHDLESFFYVLLWLCARWAWNKQIIRQGEEPPQTTLLREWRIGSLLQIASAKEGHMLIKDRFQYILDEFPKALETVKPLCSAIRGLLFPWDRETGNFLKGTPSADPASLYDAIIKAYSKAIGDL